MSVQKFPPILYQLGFGVKQLGFAEFEIAAAVLGFLYFLVDEKLLEEGVSFPRTRHGKRRRIIILKNTLPFSSLAETAWHEFAHCYFEHFGVRLFLRGSEDKYELQADDFALMCQIPTLWMRTKTWADLLDEGFTNKQIERRKWLFDNQEKNY